MESYAATYLPSHQVPITDGRRRYIVTQHLRRNKTLCRYAFVNIYSTQKNMLYCYTNNMLFIKKV